MKLLPRQNRYAAILFMILFHAEKLSAQFGMEQEIAEDSSGGPFSGLLGAILTLGLFWLLKEIFDDDSDKTKNKPNYNNYSKAKVTHDYEILDDLIAKNLTIEYKGDDVVLTKCRNSIHGEVRIPNKVTVIGDSAFHFCIDLTSVVIGNSVTSIGNGAFFGCSSLKSITIPESVKSIGVNVFHLCSRLTSITIPNSVTSIGNYAFSGCRGLTSIIIPKSVTTIGNYTFLGCSGLTFFTIPNSVTSIGASAFKGCSCLTSVTIGSGVTSIGESAFENCSDLTSVVIPNSVISIGECTFYQCSSLTSVTIGSGVTSISADAFHGCFNLAKAEFSSIERLCNISFYISFHFYGSNPLHYAHHLYVDGSEVTNLVIPDSVTCIGGFTFQGCSSLTSIIIHESVTSIGLWAFYGCSGLTTITIPKSVTSIGIWAFYGCSGLTSVTCLADEVPCTGIDIFKGVCQDIATLYVPASSIDAYKNADQWKDFAKILPIEEKE